MPTLSVHLITYNNQDYLKETLNSVLDQVTDYDYEIVIGDDFSSDATWKIISEYGKKHPNIIKAERNEKQLGILVNFKRTLDRCQGKYVFAIAGDDYLINPKALDKMIQALDSDPKIGFVDSGYDNLNMRSRVTKKFVNRNSIISSKEDYIKRILLGQITPIGVCFNRSHLYQQVDFEKYIEQGITIDDYPVLVDLIMNSDFSRIEEVLVAYRSHEKSYSHTKSFENHYFLKMQMKKLFDNFTNKYDFDESLVEEYNSSHYRTLLFLAGYFEKKSLGKEMYDKLKSKNFKDHIHYYASKYPWLRKIIRKV